MPKTEKCTRCGWFDGLRFHVCVVPIAVSTPVQREMEYEDRVAQQSRGLTSTHKEAISEAQRERWRSTSRERDVKVVNRYSEGDISYDRVADEFGISRSTVMNIMRRARQAGVVDTRPPGLNIKNGG